MKYVIQLFFIVVCSVASISTVFAAEISFSVVPSNTPNEEVVVVQASIDGKGVALNALEGTIGFLGKGAESITQFVVETGDSVFTLWPTQPLFDEKTRTVNFIAGSPDSFTGKDTIFRIRVYSTSTEPITISWLGGSAYQSDGMGTPEGISSRSLLILPEKGMPNVMSSTSDDRKPPQIISADIAYDADTYGETPFISVYATDDLSGISHYEFIEYGVKTSTTEGMYIIQDENIHEPILVIVYDKAGNISSVKVFADSWGGVVTVNNFVILVTFVLIGWLLYRVVQRRCSEKRNP